MRRFEVCEGAGPAVAGFLRARVLTVSFASPRSALVKTSRVRLVRRHSPEAALDAPPVHDDGDVRGWCSRVGADGSLRLREELRGRGPSRRAGVFVARPPAPRVRGRRRSARPRGSREDVPRRAPRRGRPRALVGPPRVSHDGPRQREPRARRRLGVLRPPRAPSRRPPNRRPRRSPGRRIDPIHPPRRPPRRPRRASRRAPRPLLRPVPPRLAARHPRTRRIAPGRRRPRRRRKSPLAG